jgi:hypothetical protein
VARAVHVGEVVLVYRTREDDAVADTERRRPRAQRSDEVTAPREDEPQGRDAFGRRTERL